MVDFGTRARGPAQPNRTEIGSVDTVFTVFRNASAGGQVSWVLARLAMDGWRELSVPGDSAE
jgi:hypothetical protein